MRFAHIADTHIRNLKYHFEYREVFKQLYKSIKEQNVDYIVHCGDIAHTKTQISPEFVELCTEFFKNLADIAETIIILGNHDGNLRNSSRQDAITPIVQAMDNKNLHLVKNSGEVWLDKDFSLYVLSCFDDESLWDQPCDPKKINIAAYHGAINKSKTDKNWTLDGDHSISIFDEFDYAFLGDIHKTQQLDTEGRIRYAGSTVQQNFGESLDKGYLLWDIQDKDNFSVEHITFNNPKPFITIPLTKSGRIPRNLDVPMGARLRITSNNNLSLDKIKKAVDVVKHRFKPESLTFLNRAAHSRPEVEAVKDLKKEDLRDVKVQETLIKEYLKDFSVEDDILKKVLELNLRYNTIIEQNEEISRNINWSLKTLEWDHLFNYGEGNVIDFSKLEGIVGIFGKNFSGKSSIVDSLLYCMFNSSSKSIRKNYNIINQNHDLGRANLTVDVAGKEYSIERSSEKYVKRLHGEATPEAKTDVDFSVIDELGNTAEMNGLSRQDTDKKIRKVFGSLEDFLSTSMSSQLGSLAFIGEGSTKRKEILAKFLDLETFDRKYKMAKEDSQDVKVALKKLEGIDYKKKIKDTTFDIELNRIKIENNRTVCESLTAEMDQLQQDLAKLEGSIASVPSEIIDPVKLQEELIVNETSIEDIEKANETISVEICDKQNKLEKINSFLDDFDIDSFREKDSLIKAKKADLQRFLTDMSKESDDRTRLYRKLDLLREVPCGDRFPNCRFIKDAHAASDLIQIAEDRMSKLSNCINEHGLALKEMNPAFVEESLEGYEQLQSKKNTLSSEIAFSRLLLEQNEGKSFRQKLHIENLKKKLLDYDDNREIIEGLKGLIIKKQELKKELQQLREDFASCEQDTYKLFRQQGSLEEKLKQLESSSRELKDLNVQYAAYDLLMSCCHSNGISYEIIKKRLPIINDEIAKILTNIVDFEIFIENESNKLNIFIKHPKHGARPLELGSGAEKTIASMAIRLAFLTVSTLPKSDIFILDEPGTALDEENMEGFVRILDMIKSYFKTVILISHLDALKDCVDSQIIIEKNNGYAYVNV